MSRFSNPKQKIIVILGPTASGKSDLCVKIALRLGSGQTSKKSARSGSALDWNGAEIISADSRQIYKGMDIGTGKITQKEMGDIPHHLLDVVNPKTKFDIVKYKKLAYRAIEDILYHKKIPIICGGTGFYIQAIVDNIIFPEVKSNNKLRKKLEKQPIEKLLQMLKKLDNERLKTVDQKNKRRVIRAVEIATILGKVPKLESNPKYDSLQIGIAINREKLKKNIKKRLEKRLKQGLITEVKKLHQQGVSWRKLIEFGLEYKFVTLYLRGKITKKQMTNQLEKSIWQYAKRQITWFKRDKRIKWVADQKEGEKLIKIFLKI